MTTSLDEPKHLGAPKKPSWTQLGLLCAVVVLMIVGVVAFVIAPLVEVHNDRYQPTDKVARSSCDWTISSYTHGDAATKDRLQKQYTVCTH